MRAAHRIGVSLLGLLAVALVCAGCGGSGKPGTILRTNQTVVALALHGSDIAWLGGGTFGCTFSLWTRVSGRTERLPLPEAVVGGWASCDDFDSYSVAQLVLVGRSVGWLVSLPGGNTNEVDEGVSSAQPRRTSTFARSWGAEGWPTMPAYTGPVVGGIAALGDRLLWGTAHVGYREALLSASEENYCDEAPDELGCQTRVDGGGVYTWSDGVSTRVPGLPPSEALASSGDLLAIVTMPRGGWRHGYARIGDVEVRDSRGRTVTRVKVSQQATLVGLSQHLLAVEYGGGDAVSVYDVPSGRLLRHVNLCHTHALVTHCMSSVVAGRTLVLWNGQRIVAVDPRSGRRRTIVAFPAPPPSGEGFYWRVTAVAADGNRLAWAETIRAGAGVVRVVNVD